MKKNKKKYIYIYIFFTPYIYIYIYIYIFIWKLHKNGGHHIESEAVSPFIPHLNRPCTRECK